METKYCFNTVNGKYCCNRLQCHVLNKMAYGSFNTVNGKYCCNLTMALNRELEDLGFNTVNGKYCCNEKFCGEIVLDEAMFQYRKR